MTKNRIDIGDMVFLYTSLSYLKIDQSLSDVAIASIPNALRYMELTKATRLEATIPYGDLPDHNKIFKVMATVNEKVLAFGSGKSKKEAEQDAARNALHVLREEEKF